MIKNNIHHKIGIVLLSIVFVLLFSFFIFNLDKSFTGDVIKDNFSDSTLNNTLNNTMNQTKIITEEDILLAFNESEEIIKEMQENNFSILYVNDTLLKAKIVFEQAKYVQILEDPFSSPEEKKEANNALRLVDSKDISYSDVLVYTDEIKNRREKAFLLFDELKIEQERLLENKDKLSNSTKLSLEEAKVAFYEDRYEEADFLISEFRAGFEKDISESSFLSAVKKASKNFVQRYWLGIIIFLILFSIGAYLFYKKREKKTLEQKIKKMNMETKVLKNLIKQAQTNRFKKNKISALNYNIKIKKYQEKLEEIKQKLPVFEKRLENLRKQK